MGMEGQQMREVVYLELCMWSANKMSLHSQLLMDGITFHGRLQALSKRLH